MKPIPDVSIQGTRAVQIQWTSPDGEAVAAVARRRKIKPLAGVMAVLGAWGFAMTSNAEAQAVLGTAQTYGVLAGSTVTNTGPSVLMGNVGVSPGSAIVGFPPGIVVPPGTIHAGDAHAAQAQVDLTTAYNTLQGLPSQVDLTGQDLGGLTLGPAVYSFATSAQLTGILTLNGLGNTAAQFVFQIGSTLTTASNSAVLLINGANGNNVFWAVGSSATLGTNTAFAGNIIALTSITLNTGASITCGRALARNGAVTLDNNVITLCASGGGGDDISVEALAGGGVGAAQQAAFEASRQFGSAMLAQAGFWLFGGPDLTGITPQTYRPMKLGATESEQERIVNQGYQPRTWRMWTTGFGGTSSLDRDAASPDLDARTAGVAVGFDAQIDRTLLVGIAGGYTHSTFDVDSLTTSGTIEGGHVGLYGVKRLGSFYLAALASYGRYGNETDRFIDWVVDDQATGDFTSDVLEGRVEAGWRQTYGVHQVTPFVALDVAHLWTDGFTEESDGLLGLTFGSSSVTSTTSSLGVQFDTRVILANGQLLMPFARLAWVHEFNPDRGVDSSLTLAPEALFSTNTPFAVDDLAKVVTGVKLNLTANTGLFAYFDGEFSDRSQSYSGNGGIRILW
jgi:uncharacterized protein with beta-barrel porin domain